MNMTRKDVNPRIVVWTVKINDVIYSARNSVFDIGRVLIEAKADLGNEKDFLTAIGRCGLKSLTNVSNYMNVAASEILNDPEVFPWLPLAVGALIDLKAWTRPEIEKGINDGIVYPGARRSELKEWIDKERSTKSQVARGEVTSDRNVATGEVTSVALQGETTTDELQKSSPQATQETAGAPAPSSPEPLWVKIYEIEADLNQLNPDTHNVIGMTLNNGIDKTLLRIKRCDSWMDRKPANDNNANQGVA
jgi:hypothetical protein